MASLPGDSQGAQDGDAVRGDAGERGNRTPDFVFAPPPETPRLHALRPLTVAPLLTFALFVLLSLAALGASRAFLAAIHFARFSGLGADGLVQAFWLGLRFDLILVGAALALGASFAFLFRRLLRRRSASPPRDAFRLLLQETSR